MDTRPYTLPCWWLLHYCSCSTIRDWIAVYLALSSLKLGLNWESMSNFLRLERNLHIFGHIFLTVSISLFWPTKAIGTNIRQFPTRKNFQIINILSCLSVISFYFSPLEIVHPVDLIRFFVLLNSVVTVHFFHFLCVLSFIGKKFNCVIRLFDM